MTKKSKTKETVILIRIPDLETRHGAGTLTLQRGDLGTITQFSYTGLTLRGNIAEALKTALVALAKLETAPPPTFATEAAPSAPTNPEAEESGNVQEAEADEGEDESTDSTDSTDTDDISEEGEELTEDSEDEDEVEPVTHLSSTTVPTAVASGVVSTNQAQISLL